MQLDSAALQKVTIDQTDTSPISIYNRHPKVVRFIEFGVVDA